ncbi:DUF397 domain-containing protein [Streptomyces sp. NBC_01511]|uniref:DUF397 domain-containing protein n=1 Tax=unclassified Streptomyces TaxID=2593676 RepID=UPI00386B3DA7
MPSSRRCSSAGTRTWVKSSYSSPEGGNCVEWSPTFADAHGVVPVRDSEDPDGPVLTVSPRGWRAFVAAL